MKKREIPELDDTIEICFLLTPEIALEPQEIPLDVLYEDAWILAVNKPAGMVVHPAPGHPKDTFVNALLFYCNQQLPLTDTLRPGIVHRLDRDTTGVLLAAKTVEAHQKLVALFAGRQIEKNYLAITVGNPKEGVVSGRIGRHPTKRQEWAVCTEGGKEAISHYRSLSTSETLALVEVKPFTGRTHQIRVHLKSLGTPVLGDALYGNPAVNRKYEAARQLLHAHRIHFVHPFTNKPIQITAPVPADMRHIAMSLSH